MNKKKIILISALVILIIVVIIVISILNPSSNTIVMSKPINEKLSLENVFEKLNQLEDFEFEYEENLKENPEKEIDFKEYDVLEKKAIVQTNDEVVNETWMIKLGSYEQQEEVCRILGNRIQKLKNAFSDNPAQLAIIEKAIIKQEDGVVIMIISKDAKTIEEAIAKEMKK